MKNLTILTLGMSVIFSCQTPPAEEPDNDTGNVEVSGRADEYKQVIDRYFEALMTLDSAGAVTTVTTDFVAYGMFAEIDTSDIQVELQAWAEAVPRRSNQSIETIAYTALTVKEGDYAGDWLQFWGTYSVTENGADIQNPFFVSAQMEDGKMKQLLYYYDRLGYVQKLGFEVTPAEGY